MKNAYRFLWVLLSLANASAGPSVVLAADKLRVGVPLVLSGDAASEGKDFYNVLTFANEKLAQGRVELIVDDERCDATQAVTIAQRFTQVDKVQYIAGFCCSHSLLAAAPIFEKNRVITIGLSTGAPQISSAGDYVFRTIPSLTTAAEKLYAYSSQRFKRVVVLAEDTEYAQGLADSFTSFNTSARLQIMRETYLPGSTDFRALLQRVRASNPDALLLLPQMESGMINMYKQILDLGWKVPVLSAYYPAYAEFLKTFGARADGIVYADLPSPVDVLEGDNIALWHEFLKRYGRMQSSDYYYIVGMSAFEAILQSASSKGPKQYLYSQPIGGATGEFRFDRNGDIQGRSFVLKVIRDGRPAQLKESE